MNYGGMSHAELLALRDSLAPNDPMQAVIAPYEHAAFAREWTQNDPMTAIPSLTVSIPAYSAAKGLGLLRTRSPASLSEMFQSYRGMGQGLLARLMSGHGT